MHQTRYAKTLKFNIKNNHDNQRTQKHFPIQRRI